MAKPKRPIRKIACVGEVMIELIAAADDRASIGVAGDTFNTAVYLARLLDGKAFSVSYVTALGRDPYSDRIFDAIVEHGLATGHIERRAGMMPGLYAIDTDDQGERSFSYWRSQSAARSLFSPPCQVALEQLNDFDLVFLSGISMAILPPPVRARLIAWADAFREGGGTLAYDSNHRPMLWQDEKEAQSVNDAMWARADIALPSLDDEMALYGDDTPEDAVRRLRALGVRNGAMKRGAEGPLDLDTLRGLEQPARTVTVIDSTAAGDSFNAGFLAQMALGKGSPQALRAGHELATRVIAQKGAIIPR